MNLGGFQDVLTTLQTTSVQRWALGGLSVAAVVAAVTTTIVGTDQTFGWFALFVISLAAVSATQPGWNTGATVIALVVIEWMAADEDVADPRTVVVGSCLFVFHGLLALMAVTPHTAAVPRVVVRTWAIRSLFVVGATIGVWVLVRIADERERVGDSRLTLAALVFVAGAAVTLRRRAVGAG